MGIFKYGTVAVFGIGILLSISGCPDSSPGLTGLTGAADALIGDGEDAGSSWDDQKFQIFLDNSRASGVPTLRSGVPLIINGTVTYPPQVNPTQIELRLVSDVEGVIDVIYPGEQGGFAYSWETPPAGLASATGGPALQRVFVQGIDPDGSVATAALYFYVNIPPGPPVFDVLPGDPSTASDLLVSDPSSVDPENANLEYSFRWVKAQGDESSGVEYAGDLLDAEKTTRGDLWIVYGTARDETHTSEESAVEVVIENTPATLDGCSVEVQGLGINASYGCQAIQWNDLDGDTLQYHVTWYKRLGDDVQELEFIESVSDFDSTLLSKKLRKGDHLFCVLTPFDGLDAGVPVISPDVTVVNSMPSVDGLVIGPEQPTVESPMNCAYNAVSDPDPDDAGELTVNLEWMVNGAVALQHTFPEGETAHSKTPAQLDASRGDAISCQFFVEDSDGAIGVAKTQSVTVVNAPPVALGVQVVSGEGGPTEEGEFHCEFAETSDPDLDVVSTIIYWEVNSHDVLDGDAKVTGNPLTSDFYDKGDVVRCALLLDDGTVFSEILSENSVVVENSIPILGGAVVTPEEPNRNDTVKCIPLDYKDADAEDGLSQWDVDDPDDTDTPHYAVQWIANGEDVLEATAAVWVPLGLAPGTELQCRIRAFDGQAYSVEVSSPGVTIVNQAPVLESVFLSPTTVYVNSPLSCNAGASYDTDGDQVELIYSWTINGQTVPGANGANLSADIQVGDEVACTVVPFDGYAFGASKNSVDRMVINQQPSLTGVSIVEASTDSGMEYRCEVEGVLDADGLAGITFSYQFSDGDGTLLQESSGDDTIDAFSLAPGTDLFCTATPYDNAGVGIALTSEPLEIQAMAPILKSVALSPVAPTHETGAVCVADVAPEDVDVTLKYQWFQDGVQLVDESSSVISAGVLNKGSTLACVVELSNEDGSVSTGSASALVGNSSPQSPAVSIIPLNPGPGVPLTCVIEDPPFDSDGDNLQLISKWLLGGITVGSQMELSAGGQPCETLTCSVVASDGMAESSPAAQASVLVGLNTILDLEGEGYGTLESGSSPHTPGSPFTIELWVYLEEVVETVLVERTANYTASGNGFGLWVTPDSQPAFVSMSSDSGQTVVEGIGGPLEAQVWTHLAVTYDGNTARLWKDGMLIGGSAGVVLDTSSGGDLSMLLGGSAITAAASMDGQMDDIRLSLVDRYGTIPFTPPTNLVSDDDTWLLLDFEGGTGQAWELIAGELFAIPEADGRLEAIPCGIQGQ